jgi:hypothetical protein
MDTAIAQARPVFNGYSGHEAPQHAALRDLLARCVPWVLDRIAAAETIEVIVDAAGDTAGEWTDYVERHPGARRADVRPGWTSYELPPTGAFAPPPVHGPSLHVASITASANANDIGAVLDGDLDTRWHTQPQRGGETITVDLGRTGHVSAVVLCLGTYAAQYPRVLEVEVSPDSVSWSPVYAGSTGLQAYDAAVSSPREVPVTLPVQRDGVRFLRLRQTGSDTHGWTIVELRVIG